MGPRIWNHRKQKKNHEVIQPAKMMYKLYQAVHHLSNLKNAQKDKNSTLFMNKVDEIDRFFRVAGASDDPKFLKESHIANLAWREVQIKIQIQHYERMIDFQKGEISACSLSKSDISSHLQTAKNWAQKNFRRKFRDSEFSQVIEAANEFVSEKKTRSEAPNQKDKTVTYDNSDGSQTKTSSNSTVESIENPLPGPSKETNNQSETEGFITPRTRNSKKRSIPDRSPDTVKNIVQDKRQKTITARDIDFGFGSRYSVLEDYPNSTPNPAPKRKRKTAPSPTSPSSVSPKATPKRVKAQINAVSDGSPALAASASEESRSSNPTETPVKNVFASQSSASPPFKDKRPNKKIQFKTSDKVKVFSRLNQGITGKKILNQWYIPKIVKPKVKIGTSNLARIEEVKQDDVQVISYSGLKINQLTKLVDAFQYGPNSQRPGMQPTHVSTMVGICDMDMSPKTNKIAISNLYSALKRQFPNSKLHFCQVPMKKELFSAKQRGTIDEFNRDLKLFCETQ